MYFQVEMIYNGAGRHAMLGTLSPDAFDVQRLGRREVGAFPYQSFPNSSSVESSKGRN